MVLKSRMKEYKLWTGEPRDVWEVVENFPKAWKSRPFMNEGGGKRRLGRVREDLVSLRESEHGAGHGSVGQVLARQA